MLNPGLLIEGSSGNRPEGVDAEIISIAVELGWDGGGEDPEEVLHVAEEASAHGVSEYIDEVAEHAERAIEFLNTKAPEGYAVIREDDVLVVPEGEEV